MAEVNLNLAVDLNYLRAAEEMYRMVAEGQRVSENFLSQAEVTTEELLHIILFIMAQGGVKGEELMKAVEMYKVGRRRVESIESEAKEVTDNDDAVERED